MKVSDRLWKKLTAKVLEIVGGEGGILEGSGVKVSFQMSFDRAMEEEEEHSLFGFLMVLETEMKIACLIYEVADEDKKIKAVIDGLLSQTGWLTRSKIQRAIADPEFLKKRKEALWQRMQSRMKDVHKSKQQARRIMTSEDFSGR
jgi:hypothetical protein